MTQISDRQWDVVAATAFIFGALVIIPSLASLLLTLLAVFGIHS
jgi:hypothetical protein